MLISSVFEFRQLFLLLVVNFLPFDVTKGHENSIEWVAHLITVSVNELSLFKFL
jgi:hypothetical protein